MDHVSDIKLIRTDTTLDLSQKAEKGMNCSVACFSFYSMLLRRSCVTHPVWDTNKQINLLAKAQQYPIMISYAWLHVDLLVANAKIGHGICFSFTDFRSTKLALLFAPLEHQNLV
jgi:hypothetical protein